MSGPWRSMLFTPATRVDRAARIARTAADVTVVDLEDAVAEADKERARAAAWELVAAVAAEAPDLDVFVRVNTLDSPWFADDVAGAAAAGVRGIVVPKAEGVDGVLAVRAACAGDVTVVAGIETAAGVQRVEAILDAGAFDGCYFGAEDFVADMGGVRTPEGAEVLYARSKVVLAARVAGVHALDQVVVSVRDDDAFRRDAEAAKALGYPGKLCLHPDQVRLAHEVFTPSPDEVARARRLLDAFAAAGGDSGGVVLFEGEMVDGPAVKRARDVLARAEA